MQLKDVDLYDLERWEQSVPHDMFALLRREAPVFWHKEPKDGAGFWALTKYADVMHVSKNAALFSSYRGGTNIFDQSPEDIDRTRSIMLNMDPPSIDGWSVRHSSHA